MSNFSFSAARPSDLLAGDFLARVVAEAHSRRMLKEAKQKGDAAAGGRTMAKVIALFSSWKQIQYGKSASIPTFQSLEPMCLFGSRRKSSRGQTKLRHKSSRGTTSS